MLKFIVIYCNAAVSDSVSADPADAEAHVLDMLRLTLHGGVDIRNCQRDSDCAVCPRNDLGVGTIGDCDAGECVSRNVLRSCQGNYWIPMLAVKLGVLAEVMAEFLKGTVY